MKTIRYTALFLMAASLTLSSLCSCVDMNNVYADAENYSSGDQEFTSEISHIDIDWNEGSVTVSRHSENTVTVTETCGVELSEEQQVHTWLDGSVLHVKYCKSGENFTLRNSEKKLEIKIPEDLELTELNYDGASAESLFEDISAETFSVDTASGNATLKSCSSDNFDFDSASGTITVEQKGKSEIIKADTASGGINITAETVDKIDVDVASGKVDLTANTAGEIEADAASGNINIKTGETNRIKADTSSGDVELTLSSMSSDIRMDTASGDILMNLPKNADFKVSYDTASGDFNSDIPVTNKDGAYISGSGKNIIKVDTASGNLTIREAE